MASLPDWEHHAIFRESFLRKLPASEAEAFRLVGRRLYLDSHESLTPDPASSSSWILEDLQGALGEMSFVADFLEDAAAAREHSRLTPRETTFATAAANTRNALLLLLTQLATVLERDACVIGSARETQTSAQRFQKSQLEKS